MKKLTQAAKADAVAELARRLEAMSENAAYADAGWHPLTRADVRYFHRRQGLLRKALVRVATAATEE